MHGDLEGVTGDVSAVEGQGGQAGPRRPARRDVRGGTWPGGVRRTGLAPVPHALPHGVGPDRGTAATAGLRPQRAEAAGPHRRRRRLAADPAQRRPGRLRVSAGGGAAVVPPGRRRGPLLFRPPGGGDARDRLRPAAVPGRRLPGPAQGHDAPSRAGRVRRDVPVRRRVEGGVPPAGQGHPRPPRAVRPGRHRDARAGAARRAGRGGGYTSLTYPFHPMDVVGWQGDLCPFRINREDFRPVVSPRYHLPPSVHAVFKSDGFEIGLFAPRPTETGDPTALRVPFFHSNIDKDEVLFYHRGEFFSRAGIGEAYITHHPQGLHHGPQAPAMEASKTKEFADEYAVMVECDLPLERDDALAAVEIEGYATSWARGLGYIQ